MTFSEFFLSRIVVNADKAIQNMKISLDFLSFKIVVGICFFTLAHWTLATFSFFLSGREPQSQWMRFYLSLKHLKFCRSRWCCEFTNILFLNLNLNNILELELTFFCWKCQKKKEEFKSKYWSPFVNVVICPSGLQWEYGSPYERYKKKVLLL